MKKFAPKPPASVVPAKVFRIEVSENTNEIGLVVAYPSENDPAEATVKAQRKIFPNEKSKLRFLVNARKQGFRNFGTFRDTLDTEAMVLNELARRQQKDKEKAQTKEKTTA
jgi:hypothetical protein